MNDATSRITGKPKILSLRETPREFRVALLRELGYGVEGNQVRGPQGEKYLDPCSQVEVSIDRMLILPGRSPPIVLDDNPLSVAWYIENYGDVF